MSVSVLARKGFCAALLAAALVSTAPASARDGRNGALIGGAAAGVVGGLALGALLNGGGAPPPGPAPRPVYVEEGPVYVAPPPRRGPICHYERRKQWLNDIEFTYKNVEVCE
ncbi:hypothetical protein ASG52_07950 [Methylobacterium sp. Leaf456]|uniref:hypothetical protein n=1 Tax=Methylobacterium sp. Leaf456 TaxID=1736382 RepID=UPI0006F933BC|nr:hypothetical protein [Methylobacterium sp. Leaf456]KQT50002.1 hypothetical protein ASG52_07950 [Methylobacterium sp. Leaf456]